MPIKDKKTKSVTTPLLDKVNNPNDLKFLKLEDLDQLSSELRSDMIDIVSKTGGHLGQVWVLLSLLSQFIMFLTP